MLAPRVAGLLVFLLTAGCVGIESAPPSKPPQVGSTEGEAVGGEPVVRPATPSTPPSPGPGIAKTDWPKATVASKAPAAPAPAEQLRKKGNAAPGPVRPAAPSSSFGNGTIFSSSKVLSLLQDGDPPPAQAITASRETIWSLLADPAKFATLQPDGRTSAVSERMTSWALIVVMTTLFAGPALAADDPSVLKDLTAVIALQGLPCGQVVSVVPQGDSDHLASCQDGNRYPVSRTSQSRAVVQQQ